MPIVQRPILHRFGAMSVGDGRDNPGVWVEFHPCQGPGHLREVLERSTSRPKTNFAGTERTTKKDLLFFREINGHIRSRNVEPPSSAKGMCRITGNAVPCCQSHFSWPASGARRDRSATIHWLILLDREL